MKWVEAMPVLDASSTEVRASALFAPIFRETFLVTTRAACQVKSISAAILSNDFIQENLSPEQSPSENREVLSDEIVNLIVLRKQ